MIGGTQLIVVYYLFPKLGFLLNIDWVSFIGISLGCILIAGGGNLINDICDIRSDAINKPGRNLIGLSIEKSKAKIYYLLLNILGVGLILITLINNNTIHKIWMYLSCIALLYLYSKKIKGILILSNLIISCLILISIWIIPLTYVEVSEFIQQKLVIGFLFSFSLVAFLLNVAREINKDIEDIRGDYANKLQTIPIVLGRNTSRLIIYIILFLSFLSILLYYYFWFERSWINLVYFILLVFTPLFWVSIEYQKQKINYKAISTLLKISMLFGILSILLI